MHCPSSQPAYGDISIFITHLRRVRIKSVAQSFRGLSTSSFSLIFQGCREKDCVGQWLGTLQCQDHIWYWDRESSGDYHLLGDRLGPYSGCIHNYYFVLLPGRCEYERADSERAVSCSNSCRFLLIPQNKGQRDSPAGWTLTLHAQSLSLIPSIREWPLNT